MGTKRTRITRARRSEVSDYVLHILSDGLFPEPEEGTYNPFEQFSVDDPYKRREYWQAAREEILELWAQKKPGKYPKAYYEYETGQEAK